MTTIDRFFDKGQALKGLEDLEDRRKAKEVADRLAGKVRQTGRTTRIIDAAIQELFEKGEVTIVDHHPGDPASRDALKRLCSRLNREHPRVTWLKTGTHTIKLKYFGR